MLRDEKKEEIMRNHKSWRKISFPGVITKLPNIYVNMTLGSPACDILRHRFLSLIYGFH